MSARNRLSICHVAGGARGDCGVLRVSGVLDAGTYHQMRDAIIKAALDLPRAVIVDVDAMTASTPSALAAFTSARWHVSQWPDVPVIVVAGDETVRRTLTLNSVSRYVPVYPTVEAAVDAVGTTEYRYRKRAALDLRDGASVERTYAFIDEHLRTWGMSDRRLAVATVAKALVENAVAYGEGGCTIRLETAGKELIVAVADNNPVLAVRRERNADDATMRGLDLVAMLSRSWHNSPTGTGKTVWAIVDRIAGVGELANSINRGGR